MIKPNEKPVELPVTFVGLGAGEQAPRFAAYQLDSAGRPVRKVGGYDGKTLKIDSGAAGSVAFGPDVEEFKALPKESLVSYRRGRGTILKSTKTCLDNGIHLTIRSRRFKLTGYEAIALSLNGLSAISNNPHFAAPIAKERLALRLQDQLPVFWHRQ